MFALWRTGAVAREDRFFTLGGRGAEEDIGVIETIGDVALGEFSSGEAAEGGEDVDGGDEALRVDCARFDFSGPASKEGNVDAAFMEGAFVSFASAGGAFGCAVAKAEAGGRIIHHGRNFYRFFTSSGTVVRAENDEGVFGEIVVVEVVEEFTNSFVSVGEGGRVDVFTIVGEVRKHLAIFWQNVEGGVWFVEPEVDEEGALFGDGFFDEVDRVKDVLIVGHLLTGTIVGTVGVVTVSERVRAVGNHFIGEVPLPVVSGAVSCGLKDAGHAGGLGIKPVGHASFLVVVSPGEVSVDELASGELSGVNGGAAGRANGAGDGEARELGTFLGEAVDVGCFDERMIVTAEVFPAPVIGKDEDDVGSWGCGSEIYSE